MWPRAVTALERFEFWDDEVIQAQQVCFAEVPRLPSLVWVNDLNDAALARAILRIRWLFSGKCVWFNPFWGEAWRELLLPRLEEEAAQRLGRKANREWRAQALARAGRKSYAEIKAGLSLTEEMEAVAGKGVRRGAQVWFRCPWHGPERTPSLHVSEDKGLWHCFGCGKGGDVITLLKKVGKL